LRRAHSCIALVGSLVLGIALLEIVSYWLLPAFDGPQGRLFLLPYEPPHCELDAIDVFFGYSAGECDTPDSIVLRNGLAIMDDPRTATEPNEDAGDPAAPRPHEGRTVLVLGGSTTDAIAMSKNPQIGFDGWALALARKCQQAFPGCRVVNGGRAAFTSAQELLLLVRDGLLFEPDVVVSLDGINEWYFDEDPILAEHPFVVRQQRYTLLNYCTDVSPYSIARWRRVMPNAVMLATLLRERMGLAEEIREEELVFEGRVGDCLLNLGPDLPETQRDAGRIWRRNVTSMEALVRAHGGRYFVFLQPTLGVGAYGAGAGHDVVLYDEMARTKPRYLARMRDLYAALRRECAELAYCIDLTDLFAGRSDVYADPRHPNRTGNALEADAVWSRIERPLEAARTE
jgi:hypothetical protein